MNMFAKLVGCGIAALSLSMSSAVAQDAPALGEVSIIAPAGAGGGCDGAARAIQQVMVEIGQARSIQVINVPGAGGNVGLAQFANAACSDPIHPLAGGISQFGACISNNAPVQLDAVKPLARLSGG